MPNTNKNKKIKATKYKVGDLIIHEATDIPKKECELGLIIKHDITSWTEMYCVKWFGRKQKYFNGIWKYYEKDLDLSEYRVISEPNKQ